MEVTYPVVDGAAKRVYAGTNSQLAAVSLSTGALLWTTQPAGPNATVAACSLRADGVVLATLTSTTTSQGWLVAVNGSSGAVIWTFDVPNVGVTQLGEQTLLASVPLSMTRG